jgi:hypothetical protein
MEELVSLRTKITANYTDTIVMCRYAVLLANLCGEDWPDHVKFKCRNNNFDKKYNVIVEEHTYWLSQNKSGFWKSLRRHVIDKNKTNQPLMNIERDPEEADEDDVPIETGIKLSTVQ